MPEVVVRQMPAFKRVFKRFSAIQQDVVMNAVREVVANPEIGEQKKGDLSGVFVYKFLLNRQQMLLAYEWDPRTRVLLLLGSHENFYRDLRRR